MKNFTAPVPTPAILDLARRIDRKGDRFSLLCLVERYVWFRRNNPTQRVGHAAQGALQLAKAETAAIQYDWQIHWSWDDGEAVASLRSNTGRFPTCCGGYAQEDIDSSVACRQILAELALQYQDEIELGVRS